MPATGVNFSHQVSATPAAALGPATTDVRALALAAIQDAVDRHLAPQAAKYDREGVYPEEAMRAFGAAGLYGQHLTGQGISPETDMGLAIEGMEIVGRACLSTAFCVWCHDACGWYLENTTNEALSERYKPHVATGVQLGATGLSNPMKYYSKIEKLKLTGKRVSGGYVVNGVLPWVSNLGEDHLFGVVFKTSAADDARRVMAVVSCDQPGVKLCDGGTMIALEGSRTFATRFKDCFVADDSLLADPADDYVDQIRPGFVLMQNGMGLGLIAACVKAMRKQERQLGHVNQHLPDGPNEIEDALGELRSRTLKLATTPRETASPFVAQVLQSRLDTGELTLRAAQSAMLHAGARAYLAASDHFRRLREAYFVAVVTPATKHLRKQLSMMRAL